jgi:hypothetical protein
MDAKNRLINTDTLGAIKAKALIMPSETDRYFEVADNALEMPRGRNFDPFLRYGATLLAIRTGIQPIQPSSPRG